MTQSMKDAVMKGQGIGLQSTSQSVGEAIAGNRDMRGSNSRKADDANTSLGEMANPSKSGPTVQSTSVDGRQQVVNQSTGTADHLDMNFRKS